MKIIVIGGQIAGSSFAVKYKKENPDDEIILVNKNIHISYITSALPLFLEDKVKEEDIILYNEEYLKSLGITLYLKSEVIAVNTEEQNIKVIKGDSGSIEVLDYDKLIIASGCNAVKLPILENKGNNIFIFKNILNVKRLKKLIKEKAPKNALVIGGGPTGISVSNSLKNLDIDVTICEKQDNILKQFGEDFQKNAREILEEKGIKILTSSEIKNVKTGFPLSLEINKKRYTFDFIVVCSGLIPNTTFMHDTNVNMTESGYIFVNEKLETNIPNIYAVGDAAVVKMNGVEEYILPKLSGSAKNQAEFLVESFNKTLDRYNGTTSPMIINIFDKTFAKVGIIEEQAIDNNLEFKKIYLEKRMYPKYIKNDNFLKINAIFNKKLDFLGVEMLGDENINLLLNYFTAALKGKLNAKDFLEEELEFDSKFYVLNEAINDLGKLAIYE